MKWYLLSAFFCIGAAVTSLSGGADVDYQVSLLVGDWETLDPPLSYAGPVQIRYDNQKRILRVTYCHDSLRFETRCDPVDIISETGTYSPELNAFDMTPQDGAPSRHYTLSIDHLRKNAFHRSWNQETIEYWRIMR